MVGLVEATVVTCEATICLDDASEIERSIAGHAWNRELDALGSINRPGKKSISYKPRTQREVAAQLSTILLNVCKRHG